MFAHRGIHAHPSSENTLPSFERALRVMDGFECDVRVSKDGVPVIVHDSTLERTHNVTSRVCDTPADDLKTYGVPTLEEVLLLLKSHPDDKLALLDLKTRQEFVIESAHRIAKRIRLPTNRLVFLVWKKVATRIRTQASILRAVDYSFSPFHSNVDGFACKYDGGDSNARSINQALDMGFHVNVWSPDVDKTQEMIDRYRNTCSITL